MGNLNEEEKALFEVLDKTKGNFIFYNSPITGDWKTNITKMFGWQINENGEKEHYKGLDISYNGNILSISDGKVKYINSNTIIV